MKRSEIQNAIRQRIKTAPVGTLLPVEFERETGFKHNGKAYANVFIRQNGTIGEWCDSRIGVIGFRIHMPKNKGIEQATIESEKFESLFAKDFKFNGVWLTDHMEELSYDTSGDNWDILTTATAYEATV